MGQDQIFDILRANPDTWYSCADLKKLLPIETSSVTSNLRRMKKNKTIDFKEEIGKDNHYRYYHRWKK